MVINRRCISVWSLLLTFAGGVQYHPEICHIHKTTHLTTCWRSLMGFFPDSCATVPACWVVLLPFKAGIKPFSLLCSRSLDVFTVTLCYCGCPEGMKGNEHSIPVSTQLLVGQSAKKRILSPQMEWHWYFPLDVNKHCTQKIVWSYFCNANDFIVWLCQGVDARNMSGETFKKPYTDFIDNPLKRRFNQISTCRFCCRESYINPGWTPEEVNL